MNLPLPPEPTPLLPPALTSGGVTYPLSGGAVTVTRGALTTPLNVTARQTARGRTWASGSRMQKAVLLPLTFQVTAPTSAEVTELANDWHARTRTATQYWEGISHLALLEPTEYQEAFGEGLTRTWTVTYLLADAHWAADGHPPHVAPLASEAAPLDSSWELLVQSVARDESGAFLRGAVQLTAITRTVYDPRSGNLAWRFGSPLLLAPLAGLLATHPEQHRTRGGTQHVVADPGAALVQVTYTLVAPSGPGLQGTSAGVLCLDPFATSPAAATQTLTLLRCEHLYLRDGTHLSL